MYRIGGDFIFKRPLVFIVMALVLGVIIVLCREKYGEMILGYVVIGVLIILLFCIVFSLIKIWISGERYGLFALKKYEKAIVAICVVACCLGMYRCNYVSRLYEKYDRIQYEVEQYEQKLNKENIYVGEVIDIKENTYGYTITVKINEGLIYVYSDKNLCGMIEDKKENCEISYEEIFLELYGKEICISGEVVPMKVARNYGNYDEYVTLRSKGVLLKISAENIWMEKKSIHDKQLTIKNIVAYGKCFLRDILQDISSDEEYGILAAMVLGESDEVDKEIKELYSLSGISHIMAVSGLHISIIGMGVYKILRKKMRYISSATISMGVMSFFLVLIGNPVSATRAVVMFFVHMIADLYGRKYDVLSALSLAGIFMLLDNPYYLLNMSFQLSFMAMIAVTVCVPCVMGFVFGEGDNDDEKGSACLTLKSVAVGIKLILKRLGKVIVFNISLCIVLLPINSYLFFRHSTYSPFVNMIVVPLVGIIVITTLSGVIIAIFLPGVGAFLVGTAIYILRFFTWLSERVVSIKYSSLVTGKLLLWQVLLCYGLLIVCLVIMYCYKEGKFNKWRPVNWIKKGQVYLGVFILMSIFCVIIFQEKYNGFSVNFLDVGQGAAIYIRSESGNDYLIDGGSTDEKNIGEYKLESFLEARQVDSLEYVFVTHCDLDHTSGIIELIERGNILLEMLVLPDIPNEAREEKYLELVKLAEDNDIQIMYMKAGDKLKDGRLSLTCLNPRVELGSSNDDSGRDDIKVSSDINENSLVFVAEYKELACIFTGDIGEETERKLISYLEEFNLQDKIVVYDVAHHGSGNSNSQEIINCIKPDASIISCGRDNSYGHPAKEVLDRLEEIGSSIWCTYERGQTEVYEGEEGFMIRGYVDYS